MAAAPEGARPAPPALLVLREPGHVRRQDRGREEGRLREGASPVKLEPRRRRERTRRPRPTTLAARQSPGLQQRAQVLADGARTAGPTVDARLHASRPVAVRYMIDGVWHNARAAGARGLRPGAGGVEDALRAEAPGPPEPAGGALRRQLQRRRLRRRLASQGTETGERVRHQVRERRRRCSRRSTTWACGRRCRRNPQGGALAAKRVRAALGHAGRRAADHDHRRAPRPGPLHARVHGHRGQAHRYEEIENIPVTTYKRGQDVPESPARAGQAHPHGPAGDRGPRPGRRRTVAALCERWPRRSGWSISTVRAKDCRRGAAAGAGAEGRRPGVRRAGDRRAQPAADPQAVRQVQGGLRPDAAGAAAVADPGGPGAGLLPPAAADAPRTRTPSCARSAAASATRAGPRCSS